SSRSCSCAGRFTPRRRRSGISGGPSRNSPGNGPTRPRRSRAARNFERQRSTLRPSSDAKTSALGILHFRKLIFVTAALAAAVFVFGILSLPPPSPSPANHFSDGTGARNHQLTT